MTEAQAVAFYESGWWKGLPPTAIVAFQLFEDRVCLPFDEYQAAVEAVLGRPVVTHEFAWPDALRKEFLRDGPAPTLEQVLALIPAEKRLLIAP